MRRPFYAFILGVLLGAFALVTVAALDTAYELQAKLAARESAP